MKIKKIVIGLLIFLMGMIIMTLFFSRKAKNLSPKNNMDNQIIGGADAPTFIYVKPSNPFIPSISKNAMNSTDGLKSVFINDNIEEIEQDKDIAYIDTDNNLIIQSLNTGEYIKKFNLEDKFYEHPRFSPDNKKIMLTNKKQILIYNLKTDKKYIIKIENTKKDIRINYDWLNNDKIIYSNPNKTGFKLYDIQKDKSYQIEDKFEHKTIIVGNDEKIYTSGYEDSQKDKLYDAGIIQTQLLHNEKKDKYEIKSSNILINAGKYQYMRYSPDLLAISKDKEMLYIIERSCSASTSTDGVGLGIYNLKDNKHTDFLNMKKWCDDLGKADTKQNQNNKEQTNEKRDRAHFNQKKQQEITGLYWMLKYPENIAISPLSNNEIAINSGTGREMQLNKQILLYREFTNPYNTEKINMDKIVTQTPVFSNSGKYIYYSGQDEKSSLNNYGRSDNIYKYDRKRRKTEKLTNKNAGDINPIPLSKNKIAFFRIKDEKRDEITADLIILSGKKENTIAKNIRLYLNENSQKAGFNFYGYTSTKAMTDITK